jgi:hypothetical protein
MKTTDQIVHQARKERADLSAYGSKILCFNLQVKMGLPPHTPPSGRPLDRNWVTPKPPFGGFSPPVPQGSGGTSPNQQQTTLTYSTPTLNEIMLK